MSTESNQRSERDPSADPPSVGAKDDDAKKKRLVQPGDLPLILIAIVPIVAIRSLILYLAWGWFVLPIWPSLPSLSYRAAVGLTVFRVTVVHPRAKSDPSETVWQTISLGLHGAALDLAVIYLTHVLIGAVR